MLSRKGTTTTPKLEKEPSYHERMGVGASGATHDEDDMTHRYEQRGEELGRRQSQREDVRGVLVTEQNAAQKVPFLRLL